MRRKYCTTRQPNTHRRETVHFHVLRDKLELPVDRGRDQIGGCDASETIPTAPFSFDFSTGFVFTRIPAVLCPDEEGRHNGRPEARDVQSGAATEQVDKLGRVGAVGHRVEEGDDSTGTFQG